MTFEEYRSKISIAEMAERLGYKKDPGAGKKYLGYYLGDKANPEDEIIIYNPDVYSQNTYFSRKGSLNDKGNLINFVMNRLDRFTCSKTGFAGVNEVLSKYLGSDLHVKYTESVNKGNIISKVKSFNIQYWNPRLLEESGIEYLHQRRKLSLQTINDFRSKYFIYTVGKSQHIAFPFRKPGQMEITNFEMRNYFPDQNKNFKGFCEGGDKANSCWIAHFVPYNQVTDIYIFESAIDAMSFYEINGFTPETTAAFISTGGHVTSDQIKGIQSLFPAINWHSCYDNDPTGNAFDVAMSYFLAGKECKAYANRLPGAPENEKTVHISLINEENKSFDGNSFSSIEYLHEHSLNNIEILKPVLGKDWNELLTYYKRFDLNLSPTAKIHRAIDATISQLNLRGYHHLSTVIQADQPKIIKCLYEGSDYFFSAPLAESPAYTLMADLQLTPIANDKVILNINNIWNIETVTQKIIFANQMLDYLKTENINLLNDFFASDIKRFLETKNLVINAPLNRHFVAETCPSGWKLKEMIASKVNSLDVDNCL